MPPANGSSMVAYRFATSALVIVHKFSRKSMDPKITVDLRPSVDGSAVCISLVVGDG